LTFSIAKDVAPGVYKGTVKVEGAEAAIPIELEVVDAVVPDLADSAMSNDIHRHRHPLSRRGHLP